MKVLYYSWDEITSADIYEMLGAVCEEVDRLQVPMVSQLQDENFIQEAGKVLENKSYDYLFSFNYFPVLTKLAEKHKICYISWVYDSPHLSLYTDVVYSDYHRIFCFDGAEVERLKSHGVKWVFHMPLAVNTKRVNAQLAVADEVQKGLFDVSFMGSLYNGEFNFYNRIQNMPEFDRGFFDALFRSQMNVYGMDFASELITESRFEDIKKYVEIQSFPGFFLTERELFIQMLQKKITSLERVELLQLVSSQYRTILFGPETDSKLSKLTYGGVLEYRKEMPLVFHNSKINLNISLRSIRSGIPLRCLDIMGAGGFLLSNYQQELVQYFEPGVEFDYFDSRDDLMRKIEYYLAHEDERETIAENGWTKVQQQFSYETKLQDIFSLVKDSWE